MTNLSWYNIILMPFYMPLIMMYTVFLAGLIGCDNPTSIKEWIELYPLYFKYAFILVIGIIIPLKLLINI